jgi:hypothetical protein
MVDDRDPQHDLLDACRPPADVTVAAADRGATDR